MLRVRFPSRLQAERQYILSELLERRLGLDCTYVPEAREDTVIEDDERVLAVADGFLAMPTQRWLAVDSVPHLAPLRLRCRDQPREFWVLQDPGAPLPIEDDGWEAWHGSNRLDVRADLFGTAFFFLTRYEEVAAPVEDRFGRYPASAAYAARHGILGRAVVDDIVAVIAGCIRRLWPRAQPRQTEFRVCVSHDVDLPLRHAWASAGRMLGGGLRDLARGGDLAGFARRMAEWHAVRHRGAVERDPYNTFDRLMTESETRGLRSAFYFIAERPSGNLDALYEIDDPFIGDLIGAIARRGHEVGLHTSFQTFLDPQRTRREFERLRSACDRQGVVQTVWGGRQHYLRWRTPQTFRNWVHAGMTYDSTLGFADQAGFRAGTCHEYRPYDLQQRRTLEVLERPLVLMDTTLMNYMGLGTSADALQAGLALKNECRRHRGQFTLLWHNSNLTQSSQWQLYLNLLDR